MTERRAGVSASRGALGRARLTRLVPTVVVPVIATVAALVYLLPRDNRNRLLETTLWSLLVVQAFAGFGSLVKFAIARYERVDMGLRVVWGAAAMCALGGLLAALALMTRGAVFVLVVLGVVLSLAALVMEQGAVRLRLRTTLRYARLEPRLALLTAAVVFFVIFHYLAGISEPHTNPYDDDIAYLSFVRKMLDTGTVLEPFSLRRLSALGGQTFFLELVAVRAAPSQGNTFDRSICVLMIVLLLVGHRHKGRRLPAFVTLLAVALVLVLPNVSINTASYYSGIAFFLGLYRTLVWLGRRERKAWQNALPVALVGAAACTLRQNYLPVPALTLGAAYAFQLIASRKEPLRARLAEPLLAGAFSLAALVPWFVVAYQSNLTFFYPVMLGTANPAMAFQSGASTPLRELHLFVWTLLEGLPLKTFLVFIVAAALVREDDRRKPLWSFVVGSMAGYAALVHGLTQGDATNIGRYASGFLVALAFATVLGTTGVRLAPRLGREQAAAGLAVVSLIIGLLDSRTDLYKYYARATHDVEELAYGIRRSPGTDPPETALYQRLQESVPRGARVAVMLDEPYHLDYARNPIWNLDMPGYASLPPGMPFFKGNEQLERYLRGLGIRYLAYVTIGYSRYHYRREYWIQEIADEQEVWRMHAPYVIDMLDNLTAIDTRHRRAFEERGLVVIDLEAPR